jgi:hypothetical protein
MADWNAAPSSPVLSLHDYLRRDWGEVGQVFRVERERTSREKHRVEVVYGWTSLSHKRCSPEHLAQVIRAHWAVENRLHWRRDATLGEDRCGVRFPEVGSDAGGALLDGFASGPERRSPNSALLLSPGRGARLGPRLLRSPGKRAWEHRGHPDQRHLRETLTRNRHALREALFFRYTYSDIEYFES